MSKHLLKTFLIAIVAIAISIISVIQHNRIQAMRQEKLGLQVQLDARSAELAELERKYKKPVESKDNSNLEELMKLRNEVSRLHALEAQWGKAKTESMQKALGQAQGVKANAEQAKAEFETKIAGITSASKAIALELRVMQMRKNLQGAFDQQGRLTPGLISKSHPGFDVSRVEFLYPDAAQLARVTQEEPETIVARTEAMAAPDGTWSRVYTLADGSVHQKSTATPTEVYEGKWKLTEVK